MSRAKAPRVVAPREKRTEVIPFPGMELLAGSACDVLTAMLRTDKIAVVDTEFLSTEKKITEIAVMRMGRQGFNWPLAWLVDPEVPVTWQHTRDTGITSDHVVGAGNFAEHLPRLAEQLDGIEYLIGWGCDGDRLKVERELKATGESYPRILWVDGLLLFRQLHPSEPASLSDALRFYGIKIPLRYMHVALFDVIATAAIMLRIAQEWADRALSSPLRIEIKGAMTNGWNPTLLTSPVAPVWARTVPGLPGLDRHLFSDRLHQMQAFPVQRQMWAAFNRWQPQQSELIYPLGQDRTEARKWVEDFAAWFGPTKHDEVAWWTWERSPERAKYSYTAAQNAHRPLVCKRINGMPCQINHIN